MEKTSITRPWFVANVVKDLKHKPPAPVIPPAKKRRKAKQESAKGKSDTPAKASFKRKGRGKAKSLSPLAKAIAKKKAKAPKADTKPSAPKAEAPEAEAKAVSTPPSKSPAVTKSPVTSYSEVSVEEFKGYLENLGIPSELFPQKKLSGTKSYTVRHPSKDNPSSLQGLWRRGMFYLICDRTGATPVTPSITWNSYGSPADAWRHCTQNLKMW